MPLPWNAVQKVSESTPYLIGQRFADSSDRYTLSVSVAHSLSGHSREVALTIFLVLVFLGHYMNKVVSIERAAMRARILNRFESAGWATKVHVGEQLVDAERALFICDVPTGTVLVGGHSADFENGLRAYGATAPYRFEDYIQCLNGLLADLSPGARVSDDLRGRLCVIGLQYLFGTQTYQLLHQARAAGKNTYPVLIGYVDAANQDRLLRPAILGAKSLPTPPEVDRFVNEVLNYDREKYPTRFATADVIPFRRE